MLKKGEWVKIEYGEYAGSYGKVTAFNKDGSLKVLPYNKNNEPESVLDLDTSGLTLIEPLIIRRKEIIEFARAEKLYRDIADQVFPPFNIRVRGHYKLEPADIALAINRINKLDDVLGAYKEWFWMIQNILYDGLSIEGRYDENIFSDMPETPDELFSTVYGLSEKLYWKLEERFVSRETTEKYIIKFDNEMNWNDDFLMDTGLEETAYKVVCEDIISRINTYEYNKDRSKKDWILSASQKRHILSTFEDRDLEKVSPAEKAVFKRSVRELCTQGDVQALKILAWGYLEGNAIYRQSFRQAYKYLNQLYMKTGDPYAANALGRLYYEGNVVKGTPDYEKAFKLFSYGAIAGVDESLFRTGDMLIHGQGTVKNIDMGINLIVDGYKENLFRFSEGDYMGHFADYAMRMGNICSENIIFGMGIRDAYKFYLEADFAIRKRLSLGGLSGDEEIKKSIGEAIKLIQEKFRPDPDRNVLKADFPIYISHIFEDRFPVKITVTEESGQYFMAMERFRLLMGDESKVLVSFPELSYVDLVSKLKFRLDGVGVVKVPESGGVFLAEGFSKNEHTGALEFYYGGECVAAIEAKWFIIDVTKEKMLKKMDQGE